MFKNRLEAAKKLIDPLREYITGDSLIMVIPRGAVPMGDLLSKELNLPLEPIPVKKIGHPHNPEYAIGAVSLNDVHFEKNIPDSYNHYLEKEIKTIQEILKKRMEEYTGNKGARKIQGKSIIIIDDGLATGQTVLLTIKSLRKQNPKEIIVAVPTSSKEAADLISQEADKLITLTVPDDFTAVGQYYNEFPQVEEEEVKKIFHARLEKH